MLNIYEKENVICLEASVPYAGKVFSFITDGLAVDTGPGSFSKAFTEFYQDASFDSVALTHSHEDHSGNALWIEQQLQKPIFVHEKGLGICAQDTPYPKYRQAVWGKREIFHPAPLGETVQSRSNEWKVLYTPGHAEDHASFFNEQTGVLFSGDLFVSPKTKLILREESIPVTMDSIRYVLSHDFGPMFCCHAGYVENGREMMELKLEYLENISGEVKYLHSTGLSAAEIQKKLFPKQYPIIAASDGEWDSIHIVASILAGEKIAK